MRYTVRPVPPAASLSNRWDDPAWAGAEILSVHHFRPESSDHHPQTSARLLYGSPGLHGLFSVRDRYVRCVHTEYFDPVWRDSCVEFFVQPATGKGYFNFEFNCGGAFLCSYITNPTRTQDGFKEWERVPLPLGRTVQTQSSLPRRVDPEIAGPVDWTLGFFIPFSLFEHYLGPLGSVKGQNWRGNFYKCGDQTSHPHWASWAPVDELNFHRPNCFGTLTFA